MKSKCFLGASLAAVLIGLASLATGADERGGSRGLPVWVMELVARQFPDAEFLRGYREGDADDQRYEVKLRQRDGGRAMSVDLQREIGVVEIDEELKADQLPERVVKSLRRAFPGADLKQAEKKSEIRVTYTIEITSHGRRREVTISPRGRILEIEKRD